MRVSCRALVKDVWNPACSVTAHVGTCTAPLQIRRRLSFWSKTTLSQNGMRKDEDQLAPPREATSRIIVRIRTTSFDHCIPKRLVNVPLVRSHKMIKHWIQSCTRLPHCLGRGQLSCQSHSFFSIRGPSSSRNLVASCKTLVR